MSGERKVYRIDEAARAYSVSAKTIERAIKKGTLRAKRSGVNGGGPHLISEKALEDWFNSLHDA